MSLKTAEFIGLIGLILCLASAWLNWSLSGRVAHIEDRQKDGKITEDQAKAKMQFWKFFSPALTLIGFGLIMVAFLNVAP